MQSGGFWTSNEFEYFANEYIYKCLSSLLHMWIKGRCFKTSPGAPVLDCPTLREAHLPFNTCIWSFSFKGYVKFWKFGLLEKLFSSFLTNISRYEQKVRPKLLPSLISVIPWCKWWLWWQSEETTILLDVLLVVHLSFKTGGKG